MKKLLLNTLLLLLTLGAFSQSSYEVNTYYKELGGYVISVYDDGAHGTVVAMQDQASGAWFWNAQTKASNPDNNDKAAKVVTGWRLPTFEELTLMNTVYKNGNAPQFNISDGSDQTESGNPYWSITAKQDGSIFMWDFADGAQFYAPKKARYNVRAVRDF